MRKNLEKRKDEELVALFQQNDPEAADVLFTRYKPHVLVKVRTLFLVGADHDDVVQEGMIALYKAARDYNADKGMSFRSFADICITRKLITAITAATRNKHKPLNSYVSLNRSFRSENQEGDTDAPLLNMIERSDVSNPEDIFLIEEAIREIQYAIEHDLTPLEKQVIHMYLDGCTYKQMAEAVGKSQKAVDNALQRVRKKMMHFCSKS